MRLRDEFLGELVAGWRRGEDRMQVRERLRPKTRQIVQANLDQREARLKQMEQRLAAEREKLARERDNPDLLIDGQLDAMMEESRFFIQAFRRQQGGGAGPGPATRPADDAQAYPADKVEPRPRD
jgi:hypothetical protein